MEWDEAKSSRFHDFAGTWPDWQDIFFSRRVGDGIVGFANQTLPVDGKVLDFGCGPGFLSEKLLDAGIACEGVDLSPDTVNQVNEKFSGHSLWGGAQVSNGSSLPFPDASFDVVFCIEIIEHVLPEHMEAMLAELRRLLKPERGRLLVTTPNNERLERNYVMCPECGSVYHRMQHVSSFTRDSLSELLQDNGFQTVACSATNLSGFSQQRPKRPLKEWSPTYIYGRLRMGTLKLLDRVFPYPNATDSRVVRALCGESCPHLWWIGTVSA